MVSVTTSAGSTALRALQSISQSMNESQTRLSTGLKVNSAKDNEFAWKIAERIRSDIKGSTAFTDAVKVSQAQADITSQALTSIRKVMTEMQGLVDTAQAAGAMGSAQTGNQAKMTGLQNQLKALVQSASFNGTNWLTGSTPSSISLGKDPDGTAMSLSLAGTNLKLIDPSGATGVFETAGTWVKAVTPAYGSILELDFTNTTGGTFAQMTVDIKNVTDKIDLAAADVSTYSSGLAIQTDFHQKINDIRSSALGSLVNADLEEESAKLSALQIQQQLATTALSIINQSQSNILRLFQ